MIARLASVLVLLMGALPAAAQTPTPTPAATAAPLPASATRDDAPAATPAATAVETPIPVPTATATPAATGDSAAKSAALGKSELGEGRRLPIGGYGEVHFTQVNGKSGGGELDLRRFILFVGHRFDEKLAFYSEVEISHSSLETEVEQAYLEYTLHPALGFRAGSILVPMGIINQFHEPPTYHGVQRPEVDDVIIPTTWREAGIAAFGEPVEGLRYQVQLVDGLNAAGFSGSMGLREGRQEAVEAKANDFGYVVRLDYSPILGLELGATGYSGKAGQQQPTLEHTGVNMVEADLRANWKGLWLRGEFAHARIEDAKTLDALIVADPIGGAVEGWYGEAAYDVLRLVRARVPSVRAELWPFARLERTNTQLAMPQGFVANQAYDRIYKTVGVSFKPIPQIAVKADYQWINARSGPLPQRWHLGIGYMF